MHVHSVVKVTVGLVMCVCVTIRLPQDGFSWNFVLVLKSVKKIQVQLKSKSDKCNGHCTWRPVCGCDDSLLNYFWVEKYFGENQNTHLMLHRFFSETVVFIGVIAKNTAEW